VVVLVPEHDRKRSAAPLLSHRCEFEDVPSADSRVIEKLKS